MMYECLIYFIHIQHFLKIQKESFDVSLQSFHSFDVIRF